MRLDDEQVERITIESNASLSAIWQCPWEPQSTQCTWRHFAYRVTVPSGHLVVNPGRASRQSSGRGGLVGSSAGGARGARGRAGWRRLFSQIIVKIDARLTDTRAVIASPSAWHGCRSRQAHLSPHCHGQTAHTTAHRGRAALFEVPGDPRRRA